MTNKPLTEEEIRCWQDDLSRSDETQLRARLTIALRDLKRKNVALRKWGCPACEGSKVRVCALCGTTGLHPIARAALGDQETDHD